MTTATYDDHEQRLRAVEQAVATIQAVIPTLATKEDIQAVRTDLERLKFQLLMAMTGLLTVAVAVLALLNRFWS